MQGSALVPQLTSLFREAGEAHHRAYSHSGGQNPEWPLWYAGHLQERLADLTGNPVWKSELINFLADAGKSQPIQAPDIDWAEFYARLFVERYL